MPVSASLDQLTCSHIIIPIFSSKIDFLKIDVEGFEYMVLLGSSNIIKNVSYIMIEIQKNNMDHIGAMA